MLKEGFSKEEECCEPVKVGWSALILQGIATSIDLFHLCNGFDCFNLITEDNLRAVLSKGCIIRKQNNIALQMVSPFVCQLHVAFYVKLQSIILPA